MNKRDFKGIWIPAEIWLDTKMTMQEKFFFVEIDSLDGDDGCFASNEYFSNFFGISKTRVSIVITSLVEKGYVKRTLICKEGTKQILKRVLNICYRPPLIKVKHPSLRKVIDPPHEKLKVNNTVNNTLTNNTIDINGNSDELPFVQVDDIDDLKATEEKEKTSAKKEKEDLLNADAVAIVELLNKFAERDFSTALTGRGSDNVKHVKSLLKKKYTREEIELMVMFKIWEWKDSPKMAKHLKPVTLFKRHGTEYIEDALMARDNPAFQKALKEAKQAESKNGTKLTGGTITRNAAESLANW